MTEQEEFEFRRRFEAEQGAKPAAKAEPSKLQQASDVVNAVGTGGNRQYLRMLGLPVDTIANVLDLLKAGAGTAYSEVTGKSVPDALTLTDRKKVFGSGDYIVDKAQQTQAGKFLVDPQNPEYEGGYLQNLGAGLAGGGRNAALGATSATLGKAVGDATGNQALAVAASMSPTAAKMAIQQGARAMAKPRDPRTVALAQRAMDQGIPLNTADITDSRFIKAARSTMNDTPGLATIGARQDAGKQPAFNRAVGKTFGADADVLTPEVMANAKGEMGKKFDKVWNSNVLEVDAPFFQQLQTARQEAAKLPQGDRQRLMGWVKDIESQMMPGVNGAPTIPGAVANRYQSKMRTEVDSASGFLKTNLQDLRQGLLGAFNRSVSGPDAQDLSTARTQYKAFKTVEPLLNKGEAGVAGRMAGDVPPSLLPGAVNQNYSSPGGTDLGQLSQIGSRFLVDRTPQTGGSARAMIQNGIVSGGVLTGVGMASPLAAAGGAGLSAAAQLAIGSPKLARALLNSGQLTPQDIQVLMTVPGLLEDVK